MKKAKLYSSDWLKKDLIASARSLDIAEKDGEMIARKTVVAVDEWVSKRGGVTEADLRRVLVRELDKINKDMAYLYRNHDKMF